MTQPLPLLVVAPAARAAVPSRLSSAVFRAKVTVLQMQRALRNLRAQVRACPHHDGAGFTTVIAESRTKLWSDERLAERVYQLGKVQNLRRAVARLDRIEIAPGATFSFWAQIGRASRRRGFVAGRMLQQGCLVPATGGGLCQLSNALYEIALQAGCEIVERHGHSRVVPGSVAASGRDATVAWNYVDLRFRSDAALFLEARVERDDLVLRLKRAPLTALVTSPLRPASPALRVRTVLRDGAPQHAQSCGTCSETTCFRHERADERPACTDKRTAFLVDENWSEFRDYVARTRKTEDVLGLPLNGATWRLARYRWADGRLRPRRRRDDRDAAARARHSRQGARTGAAQRRDRRRAADRAAAIAAAGRGHRTRLHRAVAAAVRVAQRRPGRARSDCPDGRGCR